MKIVFIVFAFFSIIFKVALCAPLLATPPSVDPFYKGPEGFENAEPGTILRWRKTPYKLRSFTSPVGIQNSWDILVRSEDSHGNPTAVVSTIVQPFNADPKKLVAYNIAQDSSDFDCSTTFAIVQGANTFDNVAAEAEFSLMMSATLLSEGYYVVTTSYETTANYTSAFTAGRLAGKAILNSIRGTLNSGNFTGLDDPDVILWGYSGGALASGWTAALMNNYAPELKENVVGCVLGGLPSNITTTLLATDGGFFAGLIATAVNGLGNEYSGLNELVQSAMRPVNYLEYIKAGELCMVPSLLHFADSSFFVGNNSYSLEGLEILNEELVVEILAQNTLALNNTEVPDIPIFMYHGTWDGIVPYVNSERVYTNWCASGAPSIEFATDLTGGHISDFVLGVPGAGTWIKNRFAGKPVVSGCQKTDYLTLLEYPSDPGLLGIVENLFSVIAGDNLGPSVSGNITKRSIPSLHQRGLLDDEYLGSVLLGRALSRQFYF